MTTLTTIPPTATSATAESSPSQISLLATPVATAERPAYTCPVVGLQSCTESGHSLGAAAGVGVAAGVTVALIIIGTFFLIHRRQTRARKMSSTIAPDVLVHGPLDYDREGWEEYREEPKDVVQVSGTMKHKEPPMYTKST